MLMVTPSVEIDSTIWPQICCLSWWLWVCLLFSFILNKGFADRFQIMYTVAALRNVPLQSSVHSIVRWQCGWWRGYSKKRIVSVEIYLWLTVIVKANGYLSLLLCVNWLPIRYHSGSEWMKWRVKMLRSFSCQHVFHPGGLQAHRGTLLLYPGLGQAQTILRQPEAGTKTNYFFIHLGRVHRCNCVDLSRALVIILLT